MNTALANLSERLLIVARDIKLSHSVFALPFALLAAFLAAGYGGELPSVTVVGLIVVCMVLARTMAMTVNRWADWRFDLGNPRTDGRAIPSGKLTPGFMLAVTIVCAVGFVGVTSLFGVIDGNWLPLAFSPLVLGWLAGYSFTKRFTWLCHLFLGVALALSPLAAVVAVNPGYIWQPTVWLLALMVACWVAGFDVIYALQDVKIDREVGLSSMPANLGVERALWISRLLHVVSIGALVAIAFVSEMLGVGFTVGVGIVAGLLVLEHVLIWRSKTNHINMAFFTVNGLVSLVLGTLGIIDVVVGLG